MARPHQYYGGAGVPLVVEADPHDVVHAWHSQRARLHAWLDALPADEWGGPTRCEGWDVTLLVRHLASATRFLGYTLISAAEGTATELLRGMDTRTTPASAAELLGDLTPVEARQLLIGADGGVRAALERVMNPRLCPAGLAATAEAPPGHVAAHLALAHFLFDSWVHEYDLLVPRGEQPAVDPVEARVVVGYLGGLASIEWAAQGDGTSPVTLGLQVTDPELRIGVQDVDGITVVTPGRTPLGAAAAVGTAADVVDRMTGRDGGPVTGDDAALVVLDRFALVLST